MSRLRRRLAVGLLVLVLLLLALPGLGFALLATESGTGWLLRHAVAFANSDGMALQVGRSEGRLLDRLTLHGITFQQQQTRVEVDRFHLAWRPRALLDRVLQLDAVEASDIRLALPPSSGDEPTAAPELPEIALPLVVRLDRLLVERVELDGTTVLDRAALAARLDRDGLVLRELSVRGSGVESSGQLAIAGSAPHRLDGALALRVDAALTGAEVGEVRADLALAGEALRPELVLGVTAPRELTVRGELELAQVTPAFDLAAAWPLLGWPLQGTESVRLSSGELTLQGTAEDYRVRLSAGVSGEGIPASRIALNGSGSLESLRFEPLDVELLDGRVGARGEVAWAPQLRWDAVVDLDRIDPGRYLPDYPGRVSGRLRLNGRLTDHPKDPLELVARLEDIAGELRGQPLRLAGKVEVRGRRVSVDGLALSSGDNRLSVNGVADRKFDLRFGISAQDLAVLYPGLSGKLTGGGTVSGSRELPTVVVDVSGEGLQLDDIRTATLQLRADWRAQGGKAELAVQGANLAGRAVGTLEARIEGEPASHRLALSLESEGLTASLGARGGWADPAWQGTLERLVLSEEAVGEWLLPDPVALRLAPDRASAGRLCLAQEAQRLCAEGGWRDRAGLDLRGELRELDLARLNRVLPGEATIEGRLDGRFGLSGPLDNPALEVSLTPGDGTFRLEEGDEPFELGYRNAALTARFRDDVGSADLKFDLGAGGQARGRLTLGADKAGDRALGGEIRAAFPDLSLVAGFVPVLDAVKGQLQVDARLGGTLAAPELRGGLQVSEASARVPPAGLELTDIAVAVRGDGTGPLAVDGSLRSGEGTLRLNGSYDLARGTADLRMAGRDFMAVRLPEAQVLVSPELRLQGAAPYRLSGTVRIPEADIELKEVPAGTVAVSDDEVIVGRGDDAAAKPRSPPLQARVRLELGDKVNFKGFGLKTRLAGALDTVVDGGDTRVDGKIEMQGATYKAYGQDLTVEQGRLLFAGPPGKPELDLRAMRQSRDGRVKAYLAMSGSLAKPRPRVYSEPALPEAEALAYLLTGSGLNQADRDQGADIAGAALSLGMSRGEPLLQDMSDRLGLDELRVESGANGIADSSLIVGKYLNPDLYLGYTQGLFDPAGAVLLRLQLTERIEVESRSGNEQSVDLFYKLEHN